MALINSKQIEFPLTGSFIDDGSGNTSISASSIIGLQLNQITSGSVTASVNIGPDIFLIKSGSNTFFNINTDSSTTLYSDLFIIKNYNTQEPVLIVSQSIVQFVTQSLDPIGNTNAGSIWFTSSSFYVGLE
jgi:hypothetical protein